MSVEHRGTKALELWSKRATQGYKGVSVDNMTTSWRDGLAFCALIHHFRPDIIDFNRLKPDQILENNALAFRVAEQQLGIPALLDAEDMVKTEVPDRLSILTYVAQYYQAFSAQGLIGPGGRRSPLSEKSTNTKVNNSTPFKSSLIPSILSKLNNNDDKTVKDSLADKPKPTNNQAMIGMVAMPAAAVPPPKPERLRPISQPPSVLQTKNESDLKKEKVVASRRHEMCVSCQKVVFLAQRLMVGMPGQLLHRTCFRCARCDTQLTLASYYETEKRQFCCETCPDEEIERKELREKIEMSKAESRVSGSSDSESDSDSSTDDSEDESLKHENGSDSVDRTDSSKLCSSPMQTPRSPKPRSIFLQNTLKNVDEKDKGEVIADGLPIEKVDIDKEIGEVKRNSIMDVKEKVTKGIIVKEDEVESIASCDDDVIFTDDIEIEIDDKKTPDCMIDKNIDSIRESGGIINSSIETNDKADDDGDTSKIIKNKPDIVPDNDDRDKENEQLSVVLSRIKIYEGKSESPRITTTKLNPSTPVEKVIDSSVPSKLYPSISEVISDVSDSVEGTAQISDSTDDVNSKNMAISNSDDDNAKTDIPVIVSSNEEVEHENAQIDSITEIDGHLDEEMYPDDLNPFGDEDESKEPEKDEKSKADINLQTEETSKIDEVAIKQDSPYPELAKLQDSEIRGSQEVSQSPKMTEKLTHDDLKKIIKGEDTSPRKVVKVNLNPFGDSDSDADEQVDNFEDSTVSKSLNPFWSDDEEESLPSTPSKGRIKPPRPPPPTLLRNSTLCTPPSPSLSCRSTNSEPSALRLRKKLRVAPRPPGEQSPNPPASTGTTPVKQRSSSSERGASRESGNRVSVQKSETGEFRRKKGPAPSRPIPQKRNVIKKLPMKQVQTELHDIDVKQTELERQGVLLETIIRERTEKDEVSDDTASSLPSNTSGADSSTTTGTESPSSSTSTLSSTQLSPSHSLPGADIEDMIIQLFELVNEKNELFRRQTELMYLKREARLEEEHADLEYQIRCLMLKPPSERVPADLEQEEELIGRLVKVVEMRDHVVSCLEMERQREAIEDESIAKHMSEYHAGKLAEGSVDFESLNKKKKKKLKLLKKKKKKEKDREKITTNDEHGGKGGCEIEAKEKDKKKKKWFKKIELVAKK